MTAIRIEAGVVPLGFGQYIYRYSDTKGYHEAVFTSETYPVLGDMIDLNTGVLIPRPLVTDKLNGLDNTHPVPIINNSPGMQAKGKRDNTWPTPNQDVR